MKFSGLKRGFSNFIADFLKGGTYPFKAFGAIIRLPSCWTWISWPVFINFLIYILLGYFYFVFLIPWVLQYLPSAESSAVLHWTYMALKTLIGTVLVILAVILFIISFTFCFFLIAPPFLDRLSLEIEKGAYSLKISEEGDWKTLFAEIALSIRNSLHLTLYMLLWTVILFPLNFLIPYVGFLPGFLVSGYYLGLSFFVYSAEHRKLSIKDLKKLAKNRKALVLGFGITTYFALFVPFLAIIFLPCAVAGGTMLYNENFPGGTANN